MELAGGEKERNGSRESGRGTGGRDERGVVQEC